MNVLVDSWAWIEYFQGTVAGKKVREVIENPEQKIIVSTINIAEVYNAFLRDYDESSAETARKTIRQRSYVIDVTEEIAIASAKIKHELKWGLGDSIIYATARREGALILTGDPHFKEIKEVIYLEK
jgi:predicted nucleic acid-binding protein